MLFTRTVGSLSYTAVLVAFVWFGPLLCAAVKCRTLHHSLSSLTLPPGEVYSATTPSGYTFYFNLCGVADGDQPNRTECVSVSGGVCGYDSRPSFAGVWGYWDGTQHSLPIFKEVSDNEVRITLTNGNPTKPIGCKAPIVTFQLSCDESKDLPVWTAVEPQTCQLTLSARTKAVCGGGGDDGISSGWIFIIFMTVLGTTYCVGGCLFKSCVQGSQGWEALPHIKYWEQVPGLVTDGCIYAWYLVTCKTRAAANVTGGGGRTYETIDTA